MTITEIIKGEPPPPLRLIDARHRFGRSRLAVYLLERVEEENETGCWIWLTRAGVIKNSRPGGQVETPRRAMLRALGFEVLLYDAPHIGVSCHNSRCINPAHCVGGSVGAYHRNPRPPGKSSAQRTATLTAQLVRAAAELQKMGVDLHGLLPNVDSRRPEQ
jgi:hypothetical protein